MYTLDSIFVLGLIKKLLSIYLLSIYYNTWCSTAQLLSRGVSKIVVINGAAHRYSHSHFPMEITIFVAFKLIIFEKMKEKHCKYISDFHLPLTLCSQCLVPTVSQLGSSSTSQTALCNPSDNQVWSITGWWPGVICYWVMTKCSPWLGDGQVKTFL